jgi:hypothetical protein
MKKITPHSVHESASQNHNKKEKPMLKEYYVVGRYIAQIPKDKDIAEFILAEMEAELGNVTPNQLKSYLNGLFTVIEGEEIEVDEDEIDE